MKGNSASPKRREGGKSPFQWGEKKGGNSPMPSEREGKRVSVIEGVTNIKGGEGE